MLEKLWFYLFLLPLGCNVIEITNIRFSIFGDRWLTSRVQNCNGRGRYNPSTTTQYLYKPSRSPAVHAPSYVRFQSHALLLDRGKAHFCTLTFYLHFNDLDLDRGGPYESRRQAQAIMSIIPLHFSPKRFPQALKITAGNGLARRAIFLFLLVVLCTLAVSNLSLFVSHRVHMLYVLPACWMTDKSGLPISQFHKKNTQTVIDSPSKAPSNHLHPLPLTATLEERLHAFRNAPGVGWEPPNFVQWNLEVRYPYSCA
jgi:hypothetical protein